MIAEICWGICLPFLGTALGAGWVFGLRGGPGEGLDRALSGFAAGIMVAASVWSLLIPALELCAGLGRLAFLPAAAGLGAGAGLLLLLEEAVPRLRRRSGSPQSRLSATALLVLAVTLHNLPEGMAVGAAYAGCLRGDGASIPQALALALGIAIQNLPEGAIISMPLRAEGMKRFRAFSWGVLSGAVEPLGALATIALAQLALPLMPFLLSLSAGAMLYVSAAELLPRAAGGGRKRLGPVMFAAGFVLMMSLDAAL